MTSIWRKRALGFSVAIAALGAAMWLAWPSAVPVDLATVSRAPMEMTVDEEARTRIRHIYTVSAPLAGTVLRTPLEVGDQVKANETVVAVIQATPPGLHDTRTHKELIAALAAADSAVSLAEAQRRRGGAALNYSRNELRRAQTLADKGMLSTAGLDKVSFAVRNDEAALATADAELELRRNERASLAARVSNPSGSVGVPAAASGIEVRAPVTGHVLRLIQESESVVPAGAPLIEIGNSQELEIVADLLSTDAVQVKPGAAVHIDGWGGAPIHGRVRRVERAGFLKVSALGIEEQRVRTIIDFTDPPAAWRDLGHDYRVIVHVVTWSGASALGVPIGALFRAGDKWAVFKDDGGRAQEVEVAIGHRNSRTAEVLSGLSDGNRVVLHPSDRVSDGARIAPRADD